MARVWGTLGLLAAYERGCQCSLHPLVAPWQPGNSGVDKYCACRLHSRFYRSSGGDGQRLYTLALTPPHPSGVL